MHEAIHANGRKFRIEDVHPIIIPDTLDIERIPAATIRRAYSGRLDRFDYKTIFYDAFYLPKVGIRLSGPPLANLSEYVKSAVFHVDGHRVTPSLADIMRKQDSVIARDPGTLLEIDFPHFSAEAKISKADMSTFDGKNVMLAINKNNALSWIVDWLSFHVSAHGIDAILLYDTGSTAYTNEDLLEALQVVDGISAATIVRWPFRHGPFRERPRVDASANYSQVAMLTHAKEKYLSQARSVIHCDVDELIYSFDGLSICDEAQKSHMGVVSVGGTWIESATIASQPYRHLDFKHVHINPSECLTKWCVAPSRLPATNNWQVHAIWGLDSIETNPKFHFAHFRGINTNWREKRAIYNAPDSQHEIFIDIETYIAPHLVGKPFYKAPNQTKGIEMSAIQATKTSTKPGEMKRSLDSGGLEALTEHLSKCKYYLEYGCGGSTVLAAKSGVQHIIAVDTALEWLGSVEDSTSKLGAKITLKHCDLGPVKAWGYPVDKKHINQFHRYAILPWEEAKASGIVPQVVFIDGRFRVACFLYSLMAAKPGTIILFDDYMNRSHYHIVEEYCPRLEARGRMGVFVTGHIQDQVKLSEAFAKYSIVES